ncbi:MAG: hypothetical protein K6F76_02035 [Clostridiales bacterium]|nr:hypothetical protein [Clostridiales bacterium]
MKIFMKICLTSVITLAICICVGFGLITAAYLIPYENTKDNLISSAGILEKEGARPTLTKYASSRLDNKTDAIMLKIAAYSGDESIIERAMMNYRYTAKGKNDVQSLSQLAEYGTEQMQKTGYARYWHGYVAVLKPLLCITDYGGVRIFNSIIYIILTVTVCVFMYRKDLKHIILPYIFSLCFLMPVATAICMQYFTVFCVMSVGIIIVLRLGDKLKDNMYLSAIFTLIGAAVVYFDFLTYPLSAFAFPCVVYFLIIKYDGIRCALMKLFQMFSCFAFGYLGMWFSKWVIAQALTGKNVLLNAANQFLYRSSFATTSESSITYSETLRRNIIELFNTPVTVLALIFIAYIAVKALKNKKSAKKISANDRSFSAVCLTVLLMPFVWYLLASNHSYMHSFFTFRTLACAPFAIMCFAAQYEKNHRPG